MNKKIQLISKKVVYDDIHEHIDALTGACGSFLWRL